MIAIPNFPSLVILALSVTLSTNLKLPEPLLLSPSMIKFKSPVSLLMISRVFDSLPNLKIPLIFVSPVRPILTFGTPVSATTSTVVADSFLIVTSELGIAVPIPNLPVFNDVNAVPPVPTFNSVDADVVPETTSPVTLPSKLPVTLPVTFPVKAPTKLVDVVTPVTSSPPVLNVAAVSYTHLTLPTKRIV